jgi:hypothetical protein
MQVCAQFSPSIQKLDINIDLFTASMTDMEGGSSAATEGTAERDTEAIHKELEIISSFPANPKA